jgi:hypothetical protein
MTVVHALPPLDIEFVKDQQALGLLPIVPQLVVPGLTDRPQDPILETIKRETAVCQPIRILERRPEPHPKLQSHDESNVRQCNKDDMLWIDAAKDDIGNTVRTNHKLLSPKKPFTSITTGTDHVMGCATPRACFATPWNSISVRATRLYTRSYATSVRLDHASHIIC